jgi:holliday junction DNA helicase RuvA
VIARLEGTLVRDGEQIVVDCNGVGYEVTCSAYTRGALPEHGARVMLKVFTHVRETEIALYGFYDHQERALFDRLITVKNVGPSTAIAILSGAAPRDLVGLIAREDVVGLTKIRGVGKKTAELIAVELHEKCMELLLSWNTEGNVRPAALPSGAPRRSPLPLRHPMLAEVAGALVGMGWRPAEADTAVADLEVTDDTSIETLLRQALRSMPR